MLFTQCRRERYIHVVDAYCKKLLGDGYIYREDAIKYTTDLFGGHRIDLPAFDDDDDFPPLVHLYRFPNGVLAQAWLREQTPLPLSLINVFDKYFKMADFDMSTSSIDIFDIDYQAFFGVEYITSSMVAKIADLDVSTVRKHIREGKLRAHRDPNGRWKIHVDDVQQWLTAISQFK